MSRVPAYLGLVFAITVVPSAAAQASLPEATIELDGSLIHARIVEDKDGRFFELNDTHVPPRWGIVRRDLGPGVYDKIDFQPVTVAKNGAKLGLATVSGKGGRWAFVIRGPAVLWEGQTDWEGEPGKRMRRIVTTRDRTGDGVDDLVVGLEREDVSVCGTSETLLEAQAWDTKSARFRPVVVERELPKDAPALQTSATPPESIVTAEPATESLVWDAASSGTARALGDESPRTVWAEGRGGDGRGEFATARWEGTGNRLRALRLDFAPAAMGFVRPSNIWLTLDSGRAFRVSILPDPNTSRVWIDLPTPARTRCVSLVLDSALARAQSATAIAGVRAFSDADARDGLLSLLDSVSEAKEAALDAKLRDALVASAQRPEALALVDRWLGAKPAVPARARLASLLATDEKTSAIAAHVLEGTRADASTVEDVWRLLHAAQGIGPTPSLGDWAEHVATTSPDWMVRLEAWKSAVHHHAAAAAVLEKAIRDASPRVRAWAASDARTAVALRARVASSDLWPLARAAAVTGLGASPEGRPTVRASLRDSSPRVRRAGVEAVTANKDASAAGEVGRLLATRGEDVGVVGAGLAYVETTCAVSLTPQVEEIAQLGVDPRSAHLAAELSAAAMRTLGALGTPRAKKALHTFASQTTAPWLVQTANEALKRPATCAP